MAKTAKKTSKKKASLEIPLEELLEAGCHFGHMVAKVHPKMREYIFMAREGVHIFDLVKTREKLKEAISFLQEVLANPLNQVIFVGTKRQAAPFVQQTAQQLGMPYITTRWVGGLLTNFEEIKKNNLKKLKKLERQVEKREEGRTKYEQEILKREYLRLKKDYEGVADLRGIPAALFIVDPKKEKTAVAEAKKMRVPVVAIVDTNTDPRPIDYIIPANDDAQKSIAYLLGKIIESLKK
ncbi:30S ribosomal protein S2 [Candidatus Shapirobacteria bacterium]|nr:30S ribosomal protein S2 [Candidatus Shapirobacteria bacterium]